MTNTIKQIEVDVTITSIENGSNVSCKFHKGTSAAEVVFASSAINSAFDDGNIIESGIYTVEYEDKDSSMKLA